MTMPNDPVFEINDPVVDFRGDTAVVTGYRVIDDPGKSNRVTVHFDGEVAPRKTEYYASVFTKVESAPDEYPQPR